MTKVTYSIGGDECAARGTGMSDGAIRTLNAEHRTPNAEVTGKCVADLDASGNPLRSYAWGPGIDDLLAVTVYGADATNTYYAIKDHLGSVHALVDASGAVAAQFSCDAWGNVLSTSYFLPITSYFPSFSLHYLFQGREYSFATGLYNFRARWYSPELGRWLSNDPIGISGGLNLYVFCGSDPVNYEGQTGS